MKRKASKRATRRPAEPETKLTIEQVAQVHRVVIPRGRGDDPDLRKWAIEAALHWPVHTVFDGKQSYYHHDEDVIGRAKKIRDFVCNGE
jgi:hypothetical protein